MGSGASEYENANWTISQVRPDYTLIKNKITSEPVRLYNKVYVDQEEYEREAKKGVLRQQCGPNVARVLKTVKEDGLTNACTKSVKCKIFTEHLISNLSELKKPLQPVQGSRVLEDAMKGFNEIKKKHGKTFLVNDSMIGFTDTDDIKVWINEDLSENSPVDDLSRSSSGEHKMAESIIDAIGSHTSPSLPPQTIHALNSQMTPLKFDSIITSLEKANELFGSQLRPQYDFSPTQRTEHQRPFFPSYDQAIIPSIQKSEFQRAFNPTMYEQTTLPAQKTEYQSAHPYQSQGQPKKELVLNLYKGPGSRI